MQKALIFIALPNLPNHWFNYPYPSQQNVLLITKAKAVPQSQKILLITSSVTYLFCPKIQQNRTQKHNSRSQIIHRVSVHSPNLRPLSNSYRIVGDGVTRGKSPRKSNNPKTRIPQTVIALVLSVSILTSCYLSSRNRRTRNPPSALATDSHLSIFFISLLPFSLFCFNPPLSTLFL